MEREEENGIEKRTRKEKKDGERERKRYIERVRELCGD